MGRELEVAVEAARKAGQILRRGLGNVKDLDYKSTFDIVTNVDRESEHLIVELLRSEFPNDHILAEESGLHEIEQATRRWLIDPLDGTANFAHGYPFFAVSIALEDEGELTVAVVYNPVADELFHAQRGEHAHLNGKRIHVSRNVSLATALLATGFPPDTRTARFTNMQQFANLTDLSYGVRRDGSAALDLAFVASGRLDGFWESKLAPWDLGAGVLLIREAGGTVTNLTGESFDIETGHIAASNGILHDELIRALAFQDIDETWSPEKAAHSSPGS